MRNGKQQRKFGKVNVVFTLKKENHKKVKERQKELRSKVKGIEVIKITSSSVVDDLISENL